MLQKTYSLYSDDLTNQQLYIEVGKNHLACWCRQAEEKKFTAFEFFQCEDYDASTFENLVNQSKLHSKLLTLDVSDTTLLWVSDKKLVIPAELNSDENFIKNYFGLIYGINDDEKFVARNYEDYLIVTSIEKYLYNAAHNVFPKASMLPSYQIVRIEDNIVQLFFYPNYFSIIIYREKKLQFFQTKHYNNPEEVLYAVLNIFQQYEIEKNTEIIIGGFINEHSKLYELLHQYLEGLVLGAVDETLFLSAEFKDYPAHYFLPYINYLL
jgi:hypothetical protein